LYFRDLAADGLFVEEVIRVRVPEVRVPALRAAEMFVPEAEEYDDGWR
jgi:hypothetical protein